METCIREKVQFIIISGDLYDANIPDLLSVKRAAEKMREVREAGIAIYVIYGSHDFSANATSMIDVLNSAGLFRKVVDFELADDRIRLNFFQDPQTGAKITGLSGRKGALEKSYYEMIDRASISSVEGFKIFAFHTSIDELRPPELTYTESTPLSTIPPEFNYYAAGHLHTRLEQHTRTHGSIVYPGPVFGATFTDLEDIAQGEKRGFYIIDFDDEVRGISFVEVKVCDIIYQVFNAEKKTARQVIQELENFATDIEVKEKIVLLKIKGTLSAGKPSDIDFNAVREALMQKGALAATINRYALSSEETLPIKVKGESRAAIEQELFKERLGSFSVDPSIEDARARTFLEKTLVGEEGADLARRLLNLLKTEQTELETKTTFQDRIWKDAREALDLDEP